MDKNYGIILKPYKPDLLSAPSREDSSRIGKHVWVKHKTTWY